MIVQAFREDELAKIYKNKLFYSIIKFSKQSEEYQNDSRNKAKNQYALNLNNTSFDHTIFNEVEDYLKSEYAKYQNIRNENQDVIDTVTEEILRTLKKESSDMNDIDKCKFIFEYVGKYVEYNSDVKKYSKDIPFGYDYDFEFYKGVPISNTYEGTLVTKSGLSDDICNLMVFLGRKLGLNIGVVPCTYNGEAYMINNIKLNDEVSYIDVTTYIKGEKPIEETCLVNRSTIITGGLELPEAISEGITQEVDFSNPYDFTQIEAMHKRILPEIQYVENDIFKKK